MSEYIVNMYRECLLTVVITAYNQERYIAQSIESVIAQTFTNIEIIIVDDGSTDSTFSICKSYAKTDSRIRLFHKDNGGSVSARKTGVKNATGKYITYIDGDDWIEANHYQQIMSNMDEADIFAYSLTCIYDSGNKEIISNYARNGVYVGKELADLKKIALYPGKLGEFGLFPSMCAKVFRRDLILDNMLLVDDDIRMGDDGACTFPSIYDAEKIIVNNDIAGYMYRKNVTDSITTSYEYKEFYRIEKLFEVLLKAFESRNADCMIEQLVYYMVFLFRTEMVKELANPTIKNIFSKIRHIQEIGKYKWVAFTVKQVARSELDMETSILVKNIHSVFSLLYNWYIVRKLV